MHDAIEDFDVFHLYMNCIAALGNTARLHIIYFNQCDVFFDCLSILASHRNIISR